MTWVPVAVVLSTDFLWIDCVLERNIPCSVGTTRTLVICREIVTQIPSKFLTLVVMFRVFTLLYTMICLVFFLWNVILWPLCFRLTMEQVKVDFSTKDPLNLKNSFLELSRYSQLNPHCSFTITHPLKRLYLRRLLLLTDIIIEHGIW